MFLSSKFNLKSLSFVLVAFCFFSVLSVQPGWAITNLKPVFTDIEVEQIAAPHNFQNSVRYIITYFVKDGKGKHQVFPTFEEKERDSDLILARVVSQYIEDEYHNNGKAIDEHVVDYSNLGQIMDLTGRDFMSKAWDSNNHNFLRQYILKNKEYLQLYTINLYLDYGTSKGEYFSGNDINPILLKLNKSPKYLDQATFITVNYTDRSRSN